MAVGHGPGSWYNRIGNAFQEAAKGARLKEKEQRERELAAAALALGARHVGPLSAQEEALAKRAINVLPSLTRHFADEIAEGRDPLGEAFCRVRGAAERRGAGAVYTPAGLVDAMVGWAARQGEPDRVVDPGAGSGRFLAAAGRAFPRAKLLGVELDPLAGLLCRAHLAAAGLGDRAEVVIGDFRETPLPVLPEGKRTLFIGNPPYVRHHLIDRRWKQWLEREGLRMGIKANGLAGLHVHFYLAVAKSARPGDVVCLVTSAEWLDVNYGRMLRDLLLNGLGLEKLVLVDAKARAFPDAQTTAVVACAKPGEQPESVSFSQVRSLDELFQAGPTRALPRSAFGAQRKWSRLLRPARRTAKGRVELGELCRVHRGQVTGANRIWIAGNDGPPLPPSVLFPAITRASELYAAGDELRSSKGLRRVIDLPADLSVLSSEDRGAVEAFLVYAKSHGAHEGYIATHRKPWWSVRLREPAPILATYMARRPPAFVVNRAGVRHLNIAHGLYPRFEMSEQVRERLADFLRRNVSLCDGRTYAGGLTKFEPREMERLLVPEPEALMAGDTCD